MNTKQTAFLISLTCLIMTVVSYYFWDIPMAVYCRDLNPDIKQIAEIITPWGVTTWYIVASTFLYLFFRLIFKNKFFEIKSLFVFLSLSATGIFITIVKWLAGRHRPIDFFHHGYFGFDGFGLGYELTSFPSGHAQTAFTLATALTILFPRWGIPLFMAAVAVSASRVILTSHYLSDVIAGAGIGILFTMAVKYCFERKQINVISNNE